ncbi:Uncharacterised protein [Tsukamurella paurometabola]|uniref:Uncharacterized protein n=1 Tax=Tsukamurella paurometabola TaxID=2061 RepID=A0A3P8JX34_TSUPA|nr:Uncharacterised protein [Tsukamurella paurometabola]
MPEGGCEVDEEFGELPVEILKCDREVFADITCPEEVASAHGQEKPARLGCGQKERRWRIGCRNDSVGGAVAASAVKCCVDVMPLLL